jgi:PII-like signaling protein
MTPLNGKRTYSLILELLKKAQISGATVCTGIGGYEKHVSLIFKLRE